MDSDQKAFGIEAVHLDQSVFVGDGAVDDEKDEVVVVVELRSLTEVLGILQGERMELKDITEYREVLLRRPGKVDPKKLPLPRRRSRLSRLRCRSPTCSSCTT